MKSTVPTKDIRVTRRFRAPPQQVFDAWLDPSLAGQWLFATASRPMTHVEIDARVAGSFVLAPCKDDTIAGHRGEYVEIVPPRRLVFTLCMPDQPHVVTRVMVDITRSKTGCELVLTHVNVPPQRAQHTEVRWTGILYGLGVMLNHH
jgi:uncharacterized protein YndB with AHSA1/START domain